MARGFTLIEILLAVAAISLLLGISIPAYTALFYKNDLDVAKNEIALSLGRASFLSRSGVGDSTWGVQAQSGAIILFKGTSFATRDSTYDESYPIANSIAITGTTEYVFTKLTGLPTPTGTITLTGGNGEVKTITINNKGMVQQ